MKRYLFFQTPDSGFDLESPQFILCGNPRIAVLNPVSNALSFLWEQIEPDPLVTAVSFVPNNTSKNVTITIPNAIVNDIILKVTLNGDVNNFRLIKIVVNLIDTPTGFTTGTGFTTYNNTLNDLLPFLLAPYPPSGSQIINYTNNTQLTGVNILGQSYRSTYVNKVELYTNSDIFISQLDIYKTLYETYTKRDDRVNINVNTIYKTLKKWADIKVLSQNIEKISQSVTLAYPTFIADEYISSISTGTGFVVTTRTPFLVKNESYIDIFNNSISTGTGFVVTTRTPFLVKNESYEESFSSSISTGTGFITTTRTPFTSNIVG